MEHLTRRVSELETQLRLKDIHIAKLAEQLKSKTPCCERKEVSPVRNTSDPEKQKLVNLVKKLYAMLQESEKLRVAALQMKQVNIIETDLNDLLKESGN